MQSVDILGKKDLKNICHDFELFGEASAEVIFDKGNLKQINAQTASTSTGQLSPHNESFS